MVLFLFRRLNVSSGKSWKIARAQAASVLVKEGKISNNHLPREREACALLGIRYPDGTTPRKKQQARKALISWFKTGNRIVTKPYWAEVVDQARAQRANYQREDIKLLSSASRFAGQHVKKINPTQFADANSDAFLSSYEWRRVRMFVLKRDGAKCACCGATPSDGVRMNVDHIKPRKLFPQLALEPTNLQVLCEVCNHGKGNWDCTDWRPAEHLSALDLDAHRRLAEIARK